MSDIEAGKDAIQGKAPCDCPGCPDCAETAAKASVEAGPDNSRRKLLFGGVVATPAVLLLSSRPVLATGGGGYRGCTASANASVNLSKPQNVSCKGLSPGCWKATRSWPNVFKPGLPDPCGGEWSTMFSVSFDSLKAYFKNKYNCTQHEGGQHGPGLQEPQRHGHAVQQRGAEDHVYGRPDAGAALRQRVAEAHGVGLPERGLFRRSELRLLGRAARRP